MCRFSRCWKTRRVPVATAAKDSPTQQVGDFYASGMDEKRLNRPGRRAAEAGT